MSVFKKCPYHRSSASIAIGQCLGHCDFGASLTICDGDMEFCEKPGTLREYLKDYDRRKEMGAAKDELQICRIRQFKDKIFSLQRGSVRMKECR